jgi:hypothetical protein
VNDSEQTVLRLIRKEMQDGAHPSWCEPRAPGQECGLCRAEGYLDALLEAHDGKQTP